MSDAPRYRTLRDYLRVVRQQRLLIILVTLVFAGAGYLRSDQQPDTYEAEASISFTDPSIELGLTGVEAPARRTPEREAAFGAQFVTSPEVGARVKEALGLDLSARDLRSRVRAVTESSTNFVVVQASGSDPAFITVLANEFARQASSLRTAQERRRFERSANSQRRRFNSLPTASNTPIIRAGFEERISRLESLADFARPAQVVEIAEVPRERVSPRPIRSAVLSGLLGLTLGLIAAFVRDTLDVRLRTASEIESTLQLPLLATVSEDALGIVGHARNGRASAPPRDVEAVRILRRNLDFLVGQSPLRLIAVTSAVPAEGKSTVASALAWAYVQAGKRTLVVDCDLRRGALAAGLGAAPAPGLTDHLESLATVTETIQQVDAGGDGAFGDGGDGTVLSFIAAGSPTERPAELLESSAFKDFLAVVSRSFDRVVLDTSPLLPVADTREILATVDAVVLCVRATSTTRAEALAVQAALEQMPPRPTGVVTTGVSPDEYPDYGYYGRTPREPAAATS